MAIKITVNGNDVKNPVARFLLTLVALVVFLVFFCVLLFLILPILWFWIFSILLLAFTLLGAVPKLKSQYRIIAIGKQKLGNNN